MKTFYVSPNGNDAWSGAYQSPNSENTDGPFASVLQARDAIRTLKASTGLPAGGVKVIVCGGEYLLREPITFSAEDSGTAEAPVTYLAAEAETVILSGGVCIADWQPVDDADTLKRLPADARRKVLRADLRAHGITDFGETPYGQKGQTSDPGVELFFRNEPMTLARYPNEGYLHIAELSVDDGHHIRGTHGSHVGRFRTTDVTPERLRRWADEPGLILHGYWFWDWSDQRIPVKAIEPDAGDLPPGNRSRF